MLPQKLAMASATRSEGLRSRFADSSNSRINWTFRLVRSSTDVSAEIAVDIEFDLTVNFVCVVHAARALRGKTVFELSCSGKVVK
jgi:hypothetical protein